jgi:hypothetical protein
MELDKLLVKIEADTSSLQRGLQEAKNKINKSTGRIGNDFRRLGSSLDTLGGQVAKFGGLLATAFGVYQVVQVVSVGKQVENLQVRLKALFGTAEEGARAFDVMRKFANRVPFSLEEIQQASGNLAVISEDANELGEVLEITGNVASATGLDFRQASEQIQRSFAGGIASADVFRERGVRAMLGFSAGAKVSINETIEAFKEKFGKGGEFGNVTDDLAKTLTGTLSMLEDKLFNFRLAIAEEFMVALKKEFGDLDKSLAVNADNIEAFGKEVGESLANLTSSVVKNAEEIKLAFETLFAIFATGLAVKAINYVRNLNVVTGTLLATLIAYNELTSMHNDALEENAEQTKKIAESNNVLGANLSRLGKKEEEAINVLEEHNKTIDQLILQQQLLNGISKEYPQILEKTIESVNPFAQAFQRVFEQLKGESTEFEKVFDKAVKNIGDAFGDAIAKGEDFGDAMKNIFQDVISQVVSLIVQILVLKPLLDSIKSNLGGDGGGFGGIVSDIGGMLGFANGGYIAPNKPAIVGEKGAEVFVPHTAGHIVPNDQMGGGVNVVQNISFSTGIVPTVRSEVMNMLPLIKQQTISAVAEQRSRGGAFAKTFGA